MRDLRKDNKMKALLQKHKQMKELDQINKAIIRNDFKEAVRLTKRYMRSKKLKFKQVMDLLYKEMLVHEMDLHTLAGEMS